MTLKFTINVAKIKTHRNRKPSEQTNKKLSSRIVGLIKEDTNGQCVCKVTAKDEKGNSLDGVYPFTPDSYELKGRLVIFTKEAKCNVYLRNETSAKEGNDPSRYTTVRKNWVCDGWIVQTDGKRYFRLNKILRPFRNIEDLNNDK